MRGKWARGGAVLWQNRVGCHGFGPAGAITKVKNSEKGAQSGELRIFRFPFSNRVLSYLP